MLFASRIAWRNEPAPESLVFMTLNTKGATGLRASVDSCAAVVSGSLAFRMRPGRVNRVGLNEVAKLEARNTGPSDISASQRHSERKSLWRGLLFHGFFGVRCGKKGKAWI